VWIASTWVRRDREECCDAVVITRTSQPKQYAELLVSLASPQPLAGLAFARHPLAARLRRILKLEDEPMLVSRNTIALLVVIFAVAAGIVYGPLRALADEEPKPTTSSTESDPGSAGGRSAQREDPLEDSNTTESNSLDATLAPADASSTEATQSEPPAEPGAGATRTDVAGSNGEPPTVEAPPADRANADGDTTTVVYIVSPGTLRDYLLDPKSRPQLGIVDAAGNRIVVTGTQAQHDHFRRIVPDFAVDNSGLRGFELAKEGKLRTPSATDQAVLPATSADTDAATPYLRTYLIPDGKTADLEQLQKWLRMPKEPNLASLPDNLLKINATKAEHDRIAKVLTDVTPKQLPFLSLEDQQIADRAYRLLGIELEALTPEEQSRVAKLGFDGGLRVSSTMIPDRRQWAHQWRNLSNNDLLVGLHVWPITGFASLDAVLKRPDLAQLSPMKFYVVRQTQSGEPVEGRDREFKNTGSGQVITGRIAIDTDQLRLLQNSPMPTALPTPVPSATYTTSPPTALPGWEAAPPTTTRQPATPSNRGSTFLPPEVPAPPATTVVPSPPSLTATPFGAAQLGPRVGPTTPALPHYPSPDPSSGFVPSGPRTQPVPPPGTEHFDPPTLFSPTAPVRQGASIAEPQREPALAPSAESPLRDEPPPLGTNVPADPPAPAEEPAPVDPPTPAVQPVPAGEPVLQLPPEPVDRAVEPNLPKSPPPLTESVPYVTDISGPPVYRYDGKTFEQWRDLWKHELSTAKRIEAVKALAAFARAGKAKEAAEAILDVAAEYEFQTMDSNLRDAITTAFAEQIKFGEWQQLLRERYEADPTKWESIATNIFRLARPATDDDLKLRQEFLLNVAEHGSQGKLLAFQSLMSSKPGVNDDQIMKLALDGLNSDDGPMASWAIMGFTSAGIYPPEFVDILLHGDEGKQRSARGWLRNNSREQGRPLVDNLLEILKDDERAADHLAAIRALGALANVAVETDALELLQQQFPTRNNLELQIATAVAIQRISGNTIAAETLLQDKVKDEAGEPLSNGQVKLLIKREEQTAFNQH
jgi:hypothetical protein